MHQGRGLQGVPGSFPNHFLRGQAAQFAIDQRQQLFRGLRIAALNSYKEPGNVVHFKEC